ncbi:DUF4411 family protein [Serratia ureilytica]|uniref:DUF4411 family protein n=1 Tax=Serratia ureilytica TaxID=300181 RepID=UPI002550C7BF|nr:DUF4411 family protein [Serratia ureilytica]MDK7594339.1 DUF4411 family protein [Serratia ureilytica]
MTYLIDANVLIEAKNKYYHMDFCPAFWDWLLRCSAGGKIFSIKNVYDELVSGNDELKDWALQNRDLFLPVSDKQTQTNLATIVQHVAQQQVSAPMSVGAMDEFLRGADTWLIAKAMTMGGTIVTHERLDVRCKKKFLIPNVCAQFNVPYINTFDLLLALNASFILAA